MVCLEVCQLVIRTGFLLPATALLLAGSLFTDVAVRLQVESIRNFEYAASEELVAFGAEEQADQAMAEAALDQAEANELEANAAVLEGEAVSEEAAAEEDEAGAAASDEGGAAAAEEGGAAAAEEGAAAAGEGAAAEGAAVVAGEEAAAGAAEGVQSAASIQAMVQEAAATAMRTIAAAGAETAAGVEAVGATSAEAAVAEAAVEGSMTAGAVAGAEAAGTAAALAAATGVIVLEGPKVVAGAEAQWAAAGNEIKAAGEENLAIEKEAEVAALEAAVPIYQGGAFAAHRAAAGSFVAGAGYICMAQLFQLVALFLQMPVALIGGGFAVGKMMPGLGLGAGLVGVKGQAVDCSAVPVLTAATAAGSLALALASALAGPWAATVIAAAEWEDSLDIAGKLAQLPGVIQKAVAAQHRDEAPASTTQPPANASNEFAMWHTMRRLAPEGGDSMNQWYVTKAHAPAQQPPTASSEKFSVWHTQQPADVADELSRWHTGFLSAGRAPAKVVDGFTAKRGLWDLTDAAGVVQGGVEAARGAATAAGSALAGQQGVLASAQQELTAKASQAQAAAGQAVGAANSLADQAARQAQEGAARAGEAMGEGIKDAREGAERAGEAAREGAQRAGEAAIEGAERAGELAREGSARAGDAAQRTGAKVHATVMGAAKQALVPPPNTATTTVTPLVVMPAPEGSQYESFIAPARDRLQSAAFHWLWKFVEDLAIISVAFAITELLCGAGRVVPTFRCGCGGSGTHFGRAKLAYSGLASMGSAWLRGAALLAAVWALSITIAPEVRHVADAVAGHPLTQSDCAVPVLATFCVAMYAVHAWVLSRQTPCECSSCASPTFIKGDAAVDVESKDALTNLGHTSLRMVWKGGVLSLEVLVALLTAAVAAAEGPVFSWAMGGAYRSFKSTRWLLVLIPWQNVSEKVDAPRLGNHTLALVGVGALSIVMIVLLAWARRRAGVSVLGDDLSTPRPTSPRSWAISQGGESPGLLFTRDAEAKRLLSPTSYSVAEQDNVRSVRYADDSERGDSPAAARGESGRLIRDASHRELGESPTARRG